MANILIRNISDESLKRLKTRAQKHNRSLQQELKEILEQFPVSSPLDISTKASLIRRRLVNRKEKFSDSAELLRADRGR